MKLKPVDRSESLTWERDLRPLFKLSAFREVRDQHGEEAAIRWVCDLALEAMREVIIGHVTEQALNERPSEVVLLERATRPIFRYLDSCCGERPWPDGLSNSLT